MIGWLSVGVEVGSKLPNDMTPTTGLNGLIEQYPDQSYGEGVENHGISPGQNRPRSRGQNISDEPSDNDGATTLPDGVVMSSYPDNSIEISFADTFNDEGATLDDFFAHNAADLTDLSWLEVDGQELERLPVNPVDTAIPELEASWSRYRGTPGIHFEPNTDREAAAYQASLEAPQTTEVPRKELTTLVQDIMRMSAANPHWTVETLIKNAKERVLREPEHVHAHLDKAAGAMKLIQAEHGLAGRVFIRAEAYPGFEQGRWTDYIKKTAAGARYIVMDEGSMHSATVQGGRCTVTKKKAVRQVPWKAARKFYSGLLAATGRKVDASADPKVALKAAFSAKAARVQDTQGPRPVHIAPSQRVSNEDAHKQLSSAKTERKVISRKDREAASELKKAQVQVGRWVVDGLLDKEDGKKLLASSLSGPEMIRLGALRITAAAEVENYSGIFNQAPTYDPVSREVVKAQLSKAGKAAKSKQATMSQMAAARIKATTRASKKEAAVHAKVQKIAAAMDRGVKGPMLKKLIRTTIARDEISIAAPILDPLLVAAAKTRVANNTKKEREFSGPKYTRHAPMSKAAALTPSKKEVSRFLRWAKLKMNEGLSGRRLDTMIAVNWTDSIVKAAQEDLQQLRDAHEGLAGNLYVDATAYASKKGSDGCEKGGLQHRTNGVKSVLAMDRCNGCVFAQKLANGSSVCSQYRKPLVATREQALPGATPMTAKQATPDALRRYQRESIRLANAPEEEQLTSLFAPSYSPDEFDLHNAGLNDIQFHAAPVEQLSEVLWGDAPIKLNGEE